MTQAGDRYVYGAKERASDPDPKAHGGAFDCSGLITWAVRRLGLVFPDGSANQLDFCRQHHDVISVAQAEHIAGALLFLGADGDEHVVCSLGNGQTIEARGAAYGVGSWSVYRDAWVAAALVPGVNYGAPPTPPTPPPPLPVAFVTRLQIALGFKAGQIDGHWGPITDGALARLNGHSSPQVAAVQRVLRQVVPALVPDGVWGPKTQAAYLAAKRLFYGR